MENKINISNRLKDCLNTKGLTQKDLCSYINVAPSTFNNWINMNRSIPAEFLIPICEFIQIDILWLLTGKNNNISNPPQIIKEVPTELSVDEDILLDLYKKTTLDGQKIIQRTVREIWEKNQRPKNEEPAAKVHPDIKIQSENQHTKNEKPVTKPRAENQSPKSKLSTSTSENEFAVTTESA